MWDDERFDELWHFDPWWVLGDERYNGHGSTANTLAAIAQRRRAALDRPREATAVGWRLRPFLS